MGDCCECRFVVLAVVLSCVTGHGLEYIPGVQHGVRLSKKPKPAALIQPCPARCVQVADYKLHWSRSPISSSCRARECYKCLSPFLHPLFASPDHGIELKIQKTTTYVKSK